MMHTIGVVTNDNGSLSELLTSLHPYTDLEPPYLGVFSMIVQHALLINNPTGI